LSKTPKKKKKKMANFYKGWGFEGWEGNVEEYWQMWGLCDNVVMRGVGVVAGGGREWCLVVVVVICGGGGGGVGGLCSGGRRDNVQRLFDTREK
jgi:hypothetical protein